MHGGKGSADRAKRNTVEKRGFRAGNGVFSTPILGSVGNLSISQKTMLIFASQVIEGLKNKTVSQELAQCDTYITPPCIAGESSH